MSARPAACCGREGVDCMSNKEVKLCPVCGTPMKPAKLDGSFKLNGKVRLGGLYCPKCVETDSNSTELDGSFKLDGSVKLGD